MSRPMHELILASAGTGKTYRLTNRFLSLLFAGVEPERILATTFTRKAAGEILARVLERLVDGAEKPKELKELQQALDAPAITGEDCRALLAKLTRNLGTFQVRTIDSFFVHLARLFALDLELPPHWRISNTRQDDVLRADAMADVLAQIQPTEMLELLRELQSGGAGRGVHQAMLDRTGKIRPLFLECAEGAWDGVDPGAKPTDDELKSALDAVRQAELPQTQKGEPSKPWTKAAEDLVRAAGSEDWDAILLKGLGKAFLSESRTFYKQELSPELCDALAPIVQRAKHAWLTDLRSRNLATLALMEHFETAYAEAKRERGAYRFEDLPLALAPRSAEKSPIDARDLDMWFRLDSRVDHLLLDEFQDTSPIQWRILSHIAREIVADGSGERSFFCVGDLKQSIYGFRQAEPRLLETLPDMLPGLEPENMDLSYRSSPIVLGTVNRVFTDLAQNPSLAGDDLGPYREAAVRWQGRFHEHRANKQLPGAAFVLEAREPAEGEQPDVALLERTVQRAVLICSESPGATVGILLRERKHIPGLIHRLRGKNIDASGEGGNELIDSEAVLAFLSLLHLADHPGDSAAAFHVASSRFGAYVELAQDAGLEPRRRLARKIRARLVAEGLGTVCAGFARQVAEDPEWSDWDRTRFAQLEDLAFAFEADAGLRPRDFVDHVRTERVEAPGGARVRVMTIHGSKGLEFDAVILPLRASTLIGKRSDLLVHRPAPDGPIRLISLAPRKEQLAVDASLKELYDQTTERMLEDALCILYVAMTRAARRLDLILPWPDPDKNTKVPSVAGFLRSSLPAAELDNPDGAGVIWSHPDNATGAGWADDLEQEKEKEKQEPVSTPTTLGLAPSTRPRALPRRSPSAEEGGSHVRAADLLRPRAAAQRGTLVHAWLEDLEWIEDFLLEEDHSLAAGAHLEPDLETRQSALDDLATALKNDEVRRALAREHCQAPAGSTLEVRNEHAFSVVLEEQDPGPELWTGSIDRLVLARQGTRVVWAEVLDYKTDQVSEQELQARVEYYAPQLRSYARVVAAQTGLAASDIPLRLVFLNLGRVVELRATDVT